MTGKPIIDLVLVLAVCYRLMEEKDCLERKVNSMGGGDKKDD